MVMWWMLACTPPPVTAPEPEPVEVNRAAGAAQRFVLAPGTLPPRPIRAGPDRDPGAPDDTGAPADTGLPADTGDDELLVAPDDTGVEELVAPPLVARLAVDLDEGVFPLAVTFDASESELGSGTVRYEWDFDDGTEVVGDVEAGHTYVGRGTFDVTLRIVDEASGTVSTAELTIDVDEPDCPSEEDPTEWASLDGRLDDLSGIAASHREPGLYWLVQDDDDDLLVVDAEGDVLAEHDMPSERDLEDLALVVDPQTGVPLLFIGDIGDNDLERDEIEVWIVEEPADPRVESDLEPLQMELVYPNGPHDAETLLVDPFTLDLFIVTKSESDEQRVYVKRAPHDGEGPYELQDLGAFDELDITATGGSVSADGSRILVRDYSDTVRMFFRDGYEPFEQAFDDDPCRIEISEASRGEGVTFTLDGTGIVTVNEGDAVLSYVEL